MPKGIPLSGVRAPRAQCAPTLNTGDVFGNFTIKSYQYHLRKYECECICGNIRYLDSFNVRHRLKSCGCLSAKLRQDRVVDSDFLSLRKDLYYRYRKGAQLRGYDFCITFDQYCDISIKNCYHCGLEPQPCRLKFSKKVDYSRYRHNGIDRLDNEIGYILSNCVPCCIACNRAKSAMTTQQWFEWCQRIANHFLLSQYTLSSIPFIEG